MERSIFGFFTAMLCLVCLLAGAQAFRKKRYGLSVLLWLNAFTNLVNSIPVSYTHLDVYKRQIHNLKTLF